MARVLRLQQAGGWYHVVNRGIDRAAIFRDQRDREHFLDYAAVGEAVRRLESQRKVDHTINAACRRVLEILLI